MKTSVFLAALLLFIFPLTSSAVEFETITFGRKRFTVCRVNVLKEQIRLFHRDEKGRPFNRFERLAPWIASRGQKLVFAMNAGMYHGDFSAVGLYVADGKESSPLNLANDEGNFFLKPNGVFLVSRSGASVIESSEYTTFSEPSILATQSGPLLVRGGRLHPAFNRTSVSFLYRNGVGVPTPETALFVISEEPVNFYEFATMFRDKLNCQDALFFDGTISCIHAPALRRSDFRMDLGPIIGVIE